MKLTVLIAVTIAACSAKDQYYRVKGTIMCGSQIVTAADLQLYDDNTGRRNTIMEEGKPNSRGQFDLSGSTSDPLSYLGADIDPYLKIHHKCVDNQWMPQICQRKTYKKLPESYIDNRNGYDMGTLNLMSESSENDCV